MKKILSILLAVIMVFGMVACTKKEDPKPADEPKVLKVAFRGDPNGLCHVNIAVASANTPAHQLIMDRLFEYNYETGKPEPMLATKWEQLTDKTYRVTLRNDVYSWNGDKFKASDVIYTIKAALDSGKHARYYGNFDLDNCKVEDDTHVVLALKKVDPFIQTTLSNIPYGMLCEASVEAGGGLAKMEGFDGSMPNCYTGPYKPVEWSTGSYVRFERNNEYWGGTPAFDEVIIYSIKDATARTDALQAGDVHLVLEPAEKQISLIEGDSKYTVLSKPTTNHHTLFTNTQKVPFDDINVRIACALALDYESNIKVALSGKAKHSDDILPVGNPQYVSPKSEGYESFYKYDLAKAKEYMAKSKYAGKDVKVQIFYTPQHEAYVPLIQQQWKEIGITVEPQPIAQSEFYTRMGTGQEQAWIVNNSNPNPYEQLKFYDGEHYDYKALNGGPGWNGGKEVTALFDQITSEPDMNKATPYYKELRKVINQNVPSIPLFVPDRLAFSVSNLDNIILTTVGDVNFSKASFK